MIYVEYLSGVAFAFMVLMFVEVVGWAIFRTPIRSYSMLIGSIVLGLLSVIRSHVTLTFMAHVGLLIVGVMAWVFLEKVLSPRRRYAGDTQARNVSKDAEKKEGEG